MPNASERFPRAKLFAEAAELQSKIEFWSGATALKAAEAEDMGLEIPHRKLLHRHSSLEEARSLITQARIVLYDCE